MILVDSSVWINFFSGTPTHAVLTLKGLLGTKQLAIGDLILAEVLQGFDAEHTARRAEGDLSEFPSVILGGRDTAVAAARNYRTLRRRGITVRKTIDTMIATACIQRGLTLLHDDRDFDAFEQHLGLRVLR